MIKVLHVEDHEDDWELAKFNLSRISDNLAIDWAQSVPEAMAKLDIEEYDCILSDYQMPGADGLELLGTIRGSGSSIPFIFLTGQGNERIAAMAFRSGADDYFTKGLGIALYDRLTNSIMRLVKLHRHKCDLQSAEASLRESEERYRKLVELSTDAIYIHTDGKISFANKATLKMLGAESPEQVIGKSILEFVHPDDMDLIKERARKFEQQCKTLPLVEVKGVKLNGEEFDAEVTSIPFFHGEKFSVQTIARDIGERKQAEQALRESEAKYRSLFENSKDVVYVTSKEGDLIDINPSGAELFGFSRDELLTMKTDVLYANSSDRKDFMRAIEETDFVKDYPLHLKRNDGTIMKVLLTSTAQRDKDGKITGYQGIIRNTTDQRRAEEELERRFKHLQTAYNMSNSLSRAEAIEEIYEQALECLQTLDADRASILLLDPKGVMRFKAWRGLSDSYRKAVEGHSPWKPGAKNPQPVLVSDVKEEKTLKSLRNLFESEGIRSLGFIPLTYQGRLLGKFMIYYNEPHRFDDEEVRLLMNIGENIAFAIESRRTEEELSRLRRSSGVQSSPDSG